MKTLSTNEQRVIDFLRRIAPESATNADIVQATGIQPHQQVFQMTRRLMAKGLIEGSRGRNNEREWAFRIIEIVKTALTLELGSSVEVIQPPKQGNSVNQLSPADFEDMARRVMSQHYGVPLVAGSAPGIPKRFDLVSADCSTIGDAKYYTLVRGTSLPPAKFSVIAEHVWLLEKTAATNRFLVFGNQRAVPTQWLARYGHLVKSVDFFFLTDTGQLEKIND